MKTLFAKVKVIPVLVFSDAATAVPTGTALVAGGLPVLEITLRTDAAWDALSALVRALPDATIGVGTVLEANQIQRAADLGAKFAVSPGFDPALTEAAAKAGLFYLPGVATATEVMAARRAGLHFLKFFPAEQAGGVALLKSFASPFGDVAFCPTGGIGPGNLADYLAQPNVVCVGGSWVAGAKDMANQDWKGIEQKAEQACAAIKSS
mgnify:FL=1